MFIFSSFLEARQCRASLFLNPAESQINGLGWISLDFGAPK
jgi:hypothetical protein